MHKLKYSSIALTLASCAVVLLAGCQSDQSACCQKPAAAAPAPVAAVVAAPAAAPAKPAAATMPAAIRIKAGGSASLVDSSGNTWLADQGFEGGDTVERADLEIANTKDAAIYRSEHYSMNSFTQKLPNGKYTVKLHFCETYEGIEGAGQRVFSFNVQGREFKDFDVWVKAGGPRRAYVETVPVEITDGKLLITFTSNVENPQINGIEIIPQS